MEQLSGYNQGRIEKIVTKGNINLDTTATCNYIGGIAGVHKGNASTSLTLIARVYTEGNIGNTTSKVGSIGGIIGSLEGINTNNSCITRLGLAYTNATVTGNNKVGGLVGAITNAEISTGYAMGKVVGTSNVGGAVGSANINSLANNIYWIKETTTQPSSALGINATISNLTKKSGYTGFNFDTTWGIEEGTSLAYLQGMPIPEIVYDLLKGYSTLEGEGTKDSPYLIKNAEQLNKVRYQMESYYQLAADIDLNEMTNWIPIGTSKDPFNGDFNGNGYSIKNMKIDKQDGYAGLFGYTQSNSKIYDFTLEDYTISAKGNYIGAVVRI